MKVVEGECNSLSSEQWWAVGQAKKMGSNFKISFLFFCSLWGIYGVNSTPEVTTPAGTFVGRKLTVNGKEVYGFHGIPYAKPPVGNLRFKRPEPLEPLTDPYDATELPNACLQPVANTFPNFQGEEMWKPNTNTSESCLYLNIWVTPEVLEQKNAPVLLWLHGGGFFAGSISMDVYNGATLAATEGVVVVNVQYRLGPLGFLYFGGEDAPGNMGLLDQALGIKWTKQNIANFGGDPESITLTGESCGSASVGFHLLSPISKGLFKRGMMTSGLPSAGYAFTPPEEMKARSFKLAKMAGCKQENCKQAMECLRKVDGSKLLSLQWKLYKNILEFPFSPTIDGYFLPDHPDRIIADGRAKRTELILGTVQDEGSFFVIYHFLNQMSHLKPTDISRDKFLELMESAFIEYSETERDMIIDQYTNWENPDDGLMNQKLISDAVGDAYFTCLHRKFADTWSSRGLPVYYYHLTERSKMNPWAEWMGVLHGDDVHLLFGKALSDPNYPEPEKQMTLNFMDLVGKFLRTGVPSSNWERYTSEHPVYLDVNASIITDQTTSNRHGPRAEACAFWNIILPSVSKHEHEHDHDHDDHEHDDHEHDHHDCHHEHHHRRTVTCKYSDEDNDSSFFGDNSHTNEV